MLCKQVACNIDRRCVLVPLLKECQRLVVAVRAEGDQQDHGWLWHVHGISVSGHVSPGTSGIFRSTPAAARQAHVDVHIHVALCLEPGLDGLRHPPVVGQQSRRPIFEYDLAATFEWEQVRDLLELEEAQDVEAVGAGDVVGGGPVRLPVAAVLGQGVEVGDFLVVKLAAGNGIINCQLLPVST